MDRQNTCSSHALTGRRVGSSPGTPKGPPAPRMADGPFGVMQLCDLGATVWKVEVVGQTEDVRGGGPMVDGINTYFFSVNRALTSSAAQGW